MVDFEFTKIQKLYEVNNDMCHNYYYIYYGKIINEDKTKFRRFKFVNWFDIFDVQEYFEKELITSEDIKEYSKIFTENCYLQDIKNYNDKKGLQEFYNYCKETIQNYNKIISY